MGTAHRRLRHAGQHQPHAVSGDAQGHGDHRSRAHHDVATHHGHFLALQADLKKVAKKRCKTSKGNSTQDPYLPAPESSPDQSWAPCVAAVATAEQVADVARESEELDEAASEAI